MGKLVLLRHAESVWNKKNIFTGWVNVGLSAQGALDAIAVGKRMAEITFDVVYVSALIRTQLTAFMVLAESTSPKTPVFFPTKEGAKLQQDFLPVYQEPLLNERRYGDLEGKDKDAIRKEYGEEQFKKWRRGYDTPPPHGESLKMTIERVVPFFRKTLRAHMEKGESVLIVAHGNTLRGIIMELEELTPEEVISLEVPTAQPIFYSYKEGKWSGNAVLG